MQNRDVGGLPIKVTENFTPLYMLRFPLKESAVINYEILL